MSADRLNPRQFKGPWYHGTSKANAESIEKTGFRSSWHGNYTLTPDRSVAEDYSLNGWSPEEGGALIEVNLPPERKAEYLGFSLPKDDAPEGEAERYDGTAWVRQDVPPGYIRRLR